MNARAVVRTQTCSPTQGRTRLEHARKFLEVAQLVGEDAEDDEYAGVATALAVLAGIAAADAACCKALGRRHRGRDHRQAADLVAEVLPGGPQAANSLRRLLNLKDAAHYGLTDVGGEHRRIALRQATTLVEFGEAIVSR